MKRACSNRRVRIIKVSAVILAASAMVIVLEARTELVRACGCAVDPSCSSTASPGDGPVPESVPPSGGRTAPESHFAEGGNLDQDRAISIPVDDGGVAFKLSLYRGLGGGVTSSLTQDGLALTFEGGAGVGGSFSVGSVGGRPEAGLSFEVRASMNSRFRLVRPPDFGLTLSGDGTLQAYMDAKTGQFRTRFRSRSISLTGEDVRGRTEAPMTRRSWSLGTEFKVAAAYTVKVPLGGLSDVWTWMFGSVPDDWNSRAPPAHSVSHLGCAAVLGRAVIRRPSFVRLRGTGRWAGAAGRYSRPRAVRVLWVPRGGRRTRSGLPRGAGPTARASWTRPHDGSASTVPDDEEPA